MSYKSIGVSMALDASNTACLSIAIEVSERFNARVIGFAATALRAPLYYTDGHYGAELLKREVEELRKSLGKAEDQFHEAMSGCIKNVEWRSSLSIAKDFIPAQARSVDLLVTSSRPESESDPYAIASPSDLVMETGRPVLVVPPSATSLDTRRILVAWKDTRESRRAVIDALPFLQKADEVTVAEVCEGSDEPEASARVNDVAAWLLQHGVAASAITSEEGNAPEDLDSIASDMGAGLIVAGAYGHSRLREWILGGVTQHLINHPSRIALLSR